MYNNFLAVKKSYEPLVNETVTIHPKKMVEYIPVTICNGDGWQVFTAHLSLVSPLSDKIIVEPGVVDVYIFN